MPGLRTIAAVDGLPAEVAVVLTRHPDTGDEVWQINRSAPVDQIADECNAVFAKMGVQCSEMRSRGRRRALWLLLAVLAGLLLPSPLRGFYAAHHALLAWLHPASVVIVGGLLLLALHEHRNMRHTRED